MGGFTGRAVSSRSVCFKPGRIKMLLGDMKSATCGLHLFGFVFIFFLVGWASVEEFCVFVFVGYGF